MLYIRDALQVDTKVEVYIDRKVGTLSSDCCEPKICQETAHEEGISCACRYRDAMVREVAKAKRNRAPDAWAASRR